jgi:hypothetical protein
MATSRCQSLNLRPDFVNWNSNFIAIKLEKDVGNRVYSLISVEGM